MGFGKVGVISVIVKCNFGKMTEMCYGLMLVCPRNSYAETLIPHPVMVLGGVSRWGFWEVIRIRWGHKGGVLMMGLVLFEEMVGCMWGHSKKVAVHKPGREVSPGTKSASTFIWDFQPPEPWENKFLCLSCPVTGILSWKPELTTILWKPGSEYVLEKTGRKNCK